MAVISGIARLLITVPLIYKRTPKPRLFAMIIHVVTEGTLGAYILFS